MSQTVNMPKLGLTMTEGKIVNWLKKVGDHIEKGEAIAEIETDKLTAEVESPFEGYLIAILAEEGDDRAITSPIAVIGEEGELGTLLDPKSAAGPERKILITPTAKRLAEEKKVDIVTVTGTGPDGRIQKEDVLKAAESGSILLPQQNPRDARLSITPLARKIAEEHGIDIMQISGTGPEGRINKEDIFRVVEGRAKADGETAEALTTTIEAPEQKNERADRKVPLTNMRKIIALKMTKSKQEIPHVYFKVRVDATDILRLKNSLSETVRAKNGRNLSVNEIIIKAAAVALRDFPLLNASLVDEEIIYHNAINIGMAVSTEKGLLVPVIPHADRLGLFALNSTAGDIVARAKDGKLTLDDISGGTFTVSNLGSLGIDEFTAIINPPESAILAVGKVVQTPVAQNGQIELRPVLIATLSVDHRIIDGSLAAQYLQRFKGLLENTDLLMV